MKKKLPLLLCLCAALLLSGCATGAETYTKYSTTFFGTFDTVVQIIGYAKDQATFDRVAAQAQAQFERYHQVYDAYHAYEGVHNMYFLNQEAAKGPVSVEPELMELLLYSREKQAGTQGTVNIALGAVLRIWHAYREEAELSPEKAAVPPMELLREAAAHVSIDDVIIDPAAGTVYFADPALSLDVGSVAKGYATERVAQWMLTSEMPSFILSAGGNVRIGEAPLDGRASWVVSVQDPDRLALIGNTEEMLEKLFVSNRSVVTSGDYQRFYEVDGVRYHHIISPQTLMPAQGFRSVTVVCEDSGLADVLSTAFFVLPYEKGVEAARALDDVEVLWVLADGTIEMTDGMAAISASRREATKGE